MLWNLNTNLTQQVENSITDLTWQAYSNTDTLRIVSEIALRLVAKVYLYRK
jgi:hypothetical protein